MLKIVIPIIIEYAPKVIAGTIILLVRWIEKRQIVNHYRTKFNKYLDEKFKD